MSQDEINQEIENYFSAVVEPAIGDWRTRNRDVPHSRARGLPDPFHFQVLIKAFPTVWERAVGPGVPSPVPVEASGTWTWWATGTPGSGHLRRRGEGTRSALRVWIEDA